MNTAIEVQAKITHGRRVFVSAAESIRPLIDHLSEVLCSRILRELDLASSRDQFDEFMRRKAQRRKDVERWIGIT